MLRNQTERGVREKETLFAQSPRVSFLKVVDISRPERFLMAGGRPHVAARVNGR